MKERKKEPTIANLLGSGVVVMILLFPVSSKSTSTTQVKGQTTFY